jgi:hypothetical protein
VASTSIGVMRVSSRCRRCSVYKCSDSSDSFRTPASVICRKTRSTTWKSKLHIAHTRRGSKPPCRAKVAAVDATAWRDTTRRHDAVCLARLRQRTATNRRARARDASAPEHGGRSCWPCLARRLPGDASKTMQTHRHAERMKRTECHRRDSRYKPLEMHLEIPWRREHRLSFAYR